MTVNICRKFELKKKTALVLHSVSYGFEVVYIRHFDTYVNESIIFKVYLPLKMFK